VPRGAARRAAGTCVRRGLFRLALSITALPLTAGAEVMFQAGFEGPPPCTTVAAGSGASFNVASILITPQFRLNGQAFAIDNSTHAHVWLANADGYQVQIGTTGALLNLPVRVLPGLYDVVYDYATGSGIPINHGARVLRNVWLDHDQTLTVDFAAVTIDGHFLHNGAAFPADATEHGNLFLDGIYYGGESVLGATEQQQRSFSILAGAYRLVYRHLSGHTVPENENALLERYDLDASGMRDFDVPSVTVNVTFRLNGGAFPGSAYESGEIRLHGSAGDSVFLYDTSADTVQKLVVPDTYDVRYQRIAGGSIVPANESAVIGGPYDVHSAASLPADVNTVDVSGDFSIDGSPTPASAYESADIYVVDPSTGAKTVIGHTYDQSFAARLIAQTYAIGYRLASGGTTMPSNPDTVIVPSWNVATQPARDVDVVSGTYSGTMTLNGSAFPMSAYESGVIYLQPLDGGPPTPVAATYDGSFNRKLLPGTYFPLYCHDSGTTVPRNSNAPVGGNRAITGSPQKADTVAVTSVTLARTLTLDGGAFPDGTNAVLVWRARQPFGDDDAVWGETSAGSASNVMVPGQYELMYQHDSGTAIPRNANQRVACWSITP
jgi:hypothetical protein